MGSVEVGNQRKDWIKKWGNKCKDQFGVLKKLVTKERIGSNIEVGNQSKNWIE